MGQQQPEGERNPCRGMAKLGSQLTWLGDAAHWQAQVKLLGWIAHIYGQDQRLRDPTLFLSSPESPLPLLICACFFCHRQGSTVECARHYFIPLTLPLKGLGLMGKINLGSMRGQVF